MMKNNLLIVFFFLTASILQIPGDVYGAEPPRVFVVDVADAISPGVSDYLRSSIEKAEAENAAMLVIRLDTPGGLVGAMRDIVMAILASRVPVAVYVSPPGARAASAGVMITMASDIAAMAPGTNIGAAHPVGVGGKEIDKTMSEKVINDMVANARSIAEKRGRNVDWVEKAVRESASITEGEALKLNVIDIVAVDLDDLIRQMNGRKIEGKGVLLLDNPRKIFLEETLRNKVLKAISDPNIAYILMMIGLAGLYFEFTNPGAIFPGVIGGISLILAFFAFQTLPVSYAGILLIILGIVFFIMELAIASYGLLSVAGIVSLLLGSLMLFKTDSTIIKLSWQVLFPTIALVSAFFIVVAGMVFKTHRTRTRTGGGGMVGEIGVVKKGLSPEGKVLVHGELWRAVAREPIEAGVKVRVVKVSNLLLEVERV